MTKRPKLNDTIAGISAKADVSRSTKNVPAIETALDLSKEIPQAEAKPKPVAGKPLPKVTLYAHADVLKAIRLLAVEDGVQAQEILRAAMKEYLAGRGHTFTDLATGQRA